MQMKKKVGLQVLFSIIIAVMFVLPGIFLLSPQTTVYAASTSTTTDVYWKFDEGVLTLRSDQIDNTYKSRNSANWYQSRDSIQEVVIANTIAPTDTNNWFAGCKNLTTITNLTNLDTSNVTDMHNMFTNCSSLTSLDLSSFDTSNVTNMHEMFYFCTGLTSLNVS